MSKGRFGIHGGQYIPETLMNAVNDLEKEYEFYKNDEQFNKELSPVPPLRPFLYVSSSR